MRMLGAIGCLILWSLPGRIPAASGGPARTPVAEKGDEAADDPPSPKACPTGRRASAGIRAELVSRAYAGDAGGKKEVPSMKYASTSPQMALAWQKELRSKLAVLLKVDDLIARKTAIPFQSKVISTVRREKYVFQDLEINSTAGRRIQVAMAVPTGLKGPFPAVVCIAGHHDTRLTCYEEGSGYFRLAHVLAEKGYVTICIRVSQHEVYEKDRTLMGERLWDLMRCLDLLASLEEVDRQRIGCAGLSLGGEMAMWLGAMDERVQAVVCAGFLTRMDQIERNHCMCWKFPGLREIADFSDIFSLIAPRALLCQNGLKEPQSQFPVSVAREALRDIEAAYKDFGKPENLSFVAHDGGHVFDLPSLMTFIEERLGRCHSAGPGGLTVRPTWHKRYGIREVSFERR
ncbi:MAG: acetylxylan esterase [Planctomycetota bacterium]|nr:acetylxylan esterase [Planctomycetota bacterium]